MYVEGGLKSQVEWQEDLALGDLVQDPREDLPMIEIGSFGLSRLEGYAESCAVRGFHIWKCETLQRGENPRRPMRMTCVDCKKNEITRNRGRPGKNRNKNNTPKAISIAQISHLNEVAGTVREKTTYDANTLFDAVCFFGGGSANKLRDIAGLAGADPWSSQSFQAALFGCGHIDIQLREDLTTPEQWWTAPPCLVEVENYEFVLSGFRSDAFLSPIREKVENLGAEIRFVDQYHAPDAVFISGLSIEELQIEFSEIEDPYRRRLRVIERPGAKIAAMVNPVSEILESLPATFSIPEKELEIFDTSRGRWRSVPEASTPGAYRTKGFGRIYFVADEGSHFYRVPYSLAKAYACRAAGTYLHIYKPESKTFISAIGCPPFGLLERALISCSGLLPKTQNGLLEYSNVPKDVAELVLKRLYFIRLDQRNECATASKQFRLYQERLSKILRYSLLAA